MSKQEYAQLVKKLSKPSPMGKDLALAFVVGGGICALGQLIQIGFEAMGLDQESSGTATTMSLIFLSALMTGLGLYDKLAKHAGAGTLVPVTGFANSIVSPAIEFKSEGFCASGGMASKMFTIAGPVIVFGVGSSVVYGLILVVFQWLTGGA
jgi:stage V sporulation protein AC